MDVRGANTFPLHNRLPNPDILGFIYISYKIKLDGDFIVF